jgi:serine/threonine protein kinase
VGIRLIFFISDGTIEMRKAFFRSKHFNMDSLKKFGRYTVVRLLGEGAMGKVYLADDPVLERKVALKVISMDSMQDTALREDFLKRFSFEAKASAKLTHPSIVAVYDAGEEAGFPWIAFEFVQGETLESCINRKGRLQLGRAIAFARDIASALRHAHGWSIVHRDIKPANILIESSTGIAKLADFGIVKAPWAVMTHEENTLGSPGYMSPEQIDGADLDERADLFCLGVVIYQMITGMHPFLRDTMPATIFATCNDDFTPLRDIVCTTPPALDWAVRRCLASDRNKRIGSANELVEMLDKIDASGAGPRATEHPQTPVAETGTIDASGAKQSPLSQQSFVLLLRTKVLEHVLSNLKNLMHQIESKTPQIRQLWPKSFPTVVLFLFAFIGVFIIGLVIIAFFAGKGPAHPSEESLQGRLIHECAIALRDNNRVSAMNSIKSLSAINHLHPLAQILIARVNIRNGNYGPAKSCLLLVESVKGGKKILAQELPAILDDISRQLKTGPAPPELVEMVRYVLLAGKHPDVRSWAHSPSYWLRFNGIKILELSGVDVDTAYVK